MTPPKKAAGTAVKKGKKSRKYLVIVESPTKEKTISRMLGSEYVVKSSYGHVRDLPEKNLGVDEKDNFTPSYMVLPRAKTMLPELKRLAASSDIVYLATDHDREGESIAWHLVQILDVDPARVRRITFHEITSQAILHSLESPREVDSRLVHAQQARRILDRLVGYKLSPLLWQKIKKGLSAGRVQSAAVRLLVERAKEIKAFKDEEYWTLSARLESPGKSPQFDSRLLQWHAETVEQVRTLKLFAEDYRVKTTSFRTSEDMAPVVNVLRQGPLTVAKVEAREVKQKPRPPFITSSLQQEAYNKLGFASERTMRIAQSLYEGVSLGGDTPVGLITYMRTDSLSVSKEIQAEAVKYISSSYGASYVPQVSPVYQTKVKGAQEAHESIHPTSVLRSPEDVEKYLSAEQSRLYELIWRRFVSSQMAEAVFSTVSVDIAAGPDAGAPECVLRSSGRTLKYDGYLKVYKDEQENEQDEEGSLLPALSKGDSLKLIDAAPKSHRTSPPPAYNEASLIKTLEKHGIGRPSTYAPILKTIVERGYARRPLKDRRIIATELGTLVTDKLKVFFPEILNLSYTAGVEDKLDEIAEGNIDWVTTVRDFYNPFSRALETAGSEMEVTKIEPKKSDELCPKCNSPMVIRESRFGQYLSCTQFPKCKGKIQLDSAGQKVVPQETSEVCELCGKPMVIRMGRRGRFLACSGYPACKNTYSLDAEGKKIIASRPVVTDRMCPKCQKNPFWLRQGKRGYFLACSGFPKCRNLLKVSKENAEAIKNRAEGK